MLFRRPTERYGNSNHSIYAQNTNLNGFLSVQEIEDKNKMVTLYPNPSTGTVVVTIESLEGAATITIINELGQVVYTTLIHSEKTELDLKHLSTGIYFYQVVGDAKNNVSSGRLVVD